ncbi:Ig-like domain-containing protein [Duffyella gerundensis]|uniref:Ig-like domain-containing protein n=1 Tax=Duffyella gerundensis TaxID=1619313 RepID=UPI0021F71B09|nr:Ig-like domain-containing protein [Duffyella gerundensis]
MQTRATLLPEAMPAHLNTSRLNVGSGVTSAEHIEQMREKLLLENTSYLHANHASCGLALIATAVSMQYLYQHQPAFIAEWLAQEAVQNGNVEDHIMSFSQSTGYQQQPVFADGFSLPSPSLNAQEGSYRSMTAHTADLSLAVADEPAMINAAGNNDVSTDMLPITATAEPAEEANNVETASETHSADSIDVVLDAGNHPLLQGIAPANSQIEIYINDQLAGISESNAAGIWTWRHDEGLENGTYQLDTSIIDPQGRTFSLAEPLTFTIDVAEQPSGLWIEELLSPASEIDFSLLLPPEEAAASEEFSLQILPEADDIWTDLLPSGLTITPMSAGSTESDRWHQDLDLLAGSQP